MINHPHITNALVDARQQELRAESRHAARAAGSGPRARRAHPGLIAAAAAVLRAPRAKSQPQARVTTDPCEDPC